MTSISDMDDAVQYYDPHTTADLLAAIDYAMQPLRDTTSREVQEAQSIRDLHTLAYGVYTVAESCHAAGCPYAETIRAIKLTLMRRISQRDRQQKEEEDHDAV